MVGRRDRPSKSTSTSKARGLKRITSSSSPRSAGMGLPSSCGSSLSSTSAAQEEFLQTLGGRASWHGIPVSNASSCLGFRVKGEGLRG